MASNRASYSCFCFFSYVAAAASAGAIVFFFTTGDGFRLGSLLSGCSSQAARRARRRPTTNRETNFTLLPFLAFFLDQLQRLLAQLRVAVHLGEDAIVLIRG